MTAAVAPDLRSAEGPNRETLEPHKVSWSARLSSMSAMAYGIIFPAHHENLGK
jgi:hypothetical protein